MNDITWRMHTYFSLSLIKVVNIQGVLFGSEGEYCVSGEERGRLSTHFSTVLWKYSCRTKHKIFYLTQKCSKNHLSPQNAFYTKRCISSPRHLSVCDISDQSMEMFYALAREEIRDEVYVKSCWCTQSQHSVKVQVRPCVSTPLLYRPSNLQDWRQEVFHSSCSDALTLLMALLKLSITLVTKR